MVAQNFDGTRPAPRTYLFQRSSPVTKVATILHVLAGSVGEPDDRADGWAAGLPRLKIEGVRTLISKHPTRGSRAAAQ
jgi:hypothetical protein